MFISHLILYRHAKFVNITITNKVLSLSVVISHLIFMNKTDFREMLTKLILTKLVSLCYAL